MKSSPKKPAKLVPTKSAPKRTRHVPTIAYFAQIFSSDLNQNLSELLNLDAFAEEGSKKCEDGKSITVWPVNLDQIKKLFSKPRRHFDIWQSKDEGDLTKVTTELQKKLFGQKISRGARIKKASEIPQPKQWTESELEKMGIHMSHTASGSGIRLYRIVGSAIGEVENQIGYGATLELAIENAKENNLWPVINKKTGERVRNNTLDEPIRPNETHW